MSWCVNLRGKSDLGKVLTIRVRNPDEQSNDVTHRFRNFGEDVWRYCRQSGLATADLGAIDSSWDSLEICNIKSRKLRTVEAEVKRLLAAHFFHDFEIVVNDESN
jgi:hypothetical protein